jgi:tRNA 2-selenouridine synthase SelU
VAVLHIISLGDKMRINVFGDEPATPPSRPEDEVRTTYDLDQDPQVQAAIREVAAAEQAVVTAQRMYEEDVARVGTETVRAGIIGTAMATADLGPAQRRVEEAQQRLEEANAALTAVRGGRASTKKVLLYAGIAAALLIIGGYFLLRKPEAK